MDVELIAVGTELLDLGRPDTNSEWLTERLQRAGARVTARTAVGDDVPRIAGQLRCALTSAEWVIVSGGLGPTEDDRTREAIAAALDVPLERDPAMLTALESRFRGHGRPFSDAQRVQADRPRGARWLANAVGIAPGFVVEARGAMLLALPGVPAELRAIFDQEVAPLLPRRAPRQRRILKIAGRTESWVDERIRDLYATPDAVVTILARPEGIEIALQVQGADPEESRTRLDELDDRIARRLGRDLYGRDEATLAAVTGEALRRAGLTLATAESCTAGLMAGAVTDVPGSSAWFRGGLVAYSDDLKVALAGVARATLAEHGAVSAAVARELARGARERCGADIGVGITGVAGPAGGTPMKPVGRVYVAVEGEGARTERELSLGGDRDLIRRRTVTYALDLVRRALLETA
jgi:nicotinamide-nucleotide amidase